MRFIRLAICAWSRPLATYRFDAGELVALSGASVSDSSWLGAAPKATMLCRKSPALNSRLAIVKSVRRAMPLLERNFLVLVENEVIQMGIVSPNRIELFARAAF